jgi:hypothetical protein
MYRMISKWELRLILLDIILESPDITLENAINQAYHLVCLNYASGLNFESFIERAVMNITEMYVVKNNWIQINIERQPLRSKDITRLLNWSYGKNLQLRITLRGIEVIEGKDSYNQNINSSASSISNQELAYPEEEEPFGYHDQYLRQN